MPATKWPAERLAFAAFLAGRGYTADRIAADKQVASMPAVVRRRLQQVGLVPQTCDEQQAMVVLPSAAVDKLRQAARARRQAPEELAAALLAILAEDPVLLANVLDDDPRATGTVPINL